MGTASPCFTPAPHIVAAEIADVDVVTVVSEVPLSYSGLKLKVDTNVFVGEEGARVRRDGRPIGRVETQEYGSKMLGLAGLDAVHGPNGATATRTVEDICNRQRVELKIEKGARLSVVLGEPPEVDGVVSGPMRVGCGSATVAMFGPALKAVADEVLVLDPDITGLLSEHLAGRGLGMTWSGLIPAGDRSTIGRYFGEAGSGIGGTRFTDPREAVASVDPDVARPGMTVFITETAGELGFLFRLNDSLELEPVPLSPEAHRAMALIRENSEPSRVSALFVAGLGGSARSGVTRFPIKLNEAVRAGTVRLTVGGAPVFLLPGGGITILVDVEKLPAGAITRVPSPAMVAPVEYTMTRETYALIEGHVDNVRPLDVVLGERSHRFTAESPSQFVQSRPIRM
ncbi:MAG: 6-hydroxynicotinate reductase [Thermoleophilia bacterium]|nr:6-hydroxynicotinate reductase [Thermoleophilia bacterium]